MFSKNIPKESNVASFCFHHYPCFFAYFSSSAKSFKIKVGKMSSLILIPHLGLLLVLNRVIMERIFWDRAQILLFLRLNNSKSINREQSNPQNSELNLLGRICLVYLCLFFLMSAIPPASSCSQEKISWNEMNEWRLNPLINEWVSK